MLPHAGIHPQGRWMRNAYSGGARWREDAALIETVVHLTEWPSVVLGDLSPST